MTDVRLPQWVAKHRPENTRPPLDKVIAALKEQGVTEFGATEYCFGGTLFTKIGLCMYSNLIGAQGAMFLISHLKTSSKWQLFLTLL